MFLFRVSKCVVSEYQLAGNDDNEQAYIMTSWAKFVYLG